MVTNTAELPRLSSDLMSLRITIKWQSFTLKGNNEIIVLPNNICVSLTKWFKTKRVLAALDKVQISCKYADRMHKMHGT